jgi:hypothetical protein
MAVTKATSGCVKWPARTNAIAIVSCAIRPMAHDSNRNRVYSDRSRARQRAMGAPVTNNTSRTTSVRATSAISACRDLGASGHPGSPPMRSG